MKRAFLGLSLLASSGLMVLACGDDGSSGGSSCATGEVACSDAADGCIPAADSTLTWVQSNVFDVHGCAASSACHNGQNVDPRASFDLSDEQASFASLVGVESAEVGPMLVVEAGDSNASYLVNKLTGEGMAPGTLLMPLGAVTPLCDAKIDGVRAWIDAGANP